MTLWLFNYQNLSLLANFFVEKGTLFPGWSPVKIKVYLTYSILLLETQILENLQIDCLGPSIKEELRTYLGQFGDKGVQLWYHPYQRKFV